MSHFCEGDFRGGTCTCSGCLADQMEEFNKMNAPAQRVTGQKRVCDCPGKHMGECYCPLPDAAPYKAPGPFATPHEAEMLQNLAEECAEVTQKAMKMLRFGLDDRDPDDPKNNRWRIGEELGNLIAMIGVCEELGLISTDGVEYGLNKKLQGLLKWSQHMTPETKAWIEDQLNG